MDLIDIDCKEFKKFIYPQYIKLFPENERKSYRIIEKTVKKNVANIIKIVQNNEIVGFMIVNTLKDNLYVQEDYLAILQEYQGYGFGSKALKLLKDKYKDYNGIFIEIEKTGFGKDDDENNIRERRKKFYEKLGFKNLGIDIEMFGILFETYNLECSKNEDDNREIMKNILKIYYEIFGKRKVKKYIKIRK